MTVSRTEALSAEPSESPSRPFFFPVSKDEKSLREHERTAIGGGHLMGGSWAALGAAGALPLTWSEVPQPPWRLLESRKKSLSSSRFLHGNPKSLPHMAPTRRPRVACG